MKSLRLGVALLGAAILVLTYTSKPAAFHSGGVAECAGCHSMHSAKANGSALLVGSDQSSTCLTCHEHAGDTGPSSYHVSTAQADLGNNATPKQRTPGGDFGWLRKSYSYTGETGAIETEDGSTHGHNIVAADFGYVADTANGGKAPGGTFSSAKLACSSCHNPHGTYRRLNDGTIALAGAPIKASGSYNGANAANEPTATEAVGVYRLLAGSGYKTADNTSIPFPGVPAAKVPSTYNQTEATNQVKTAYGVKTTGGHSTWGQWCSTCHPNMHSQGNYVHPIDQALGSEILGNYNSYLKSGDMSGTQANSYLSLVPYATNSGDYTALSALAGNNKATYSGPSDGDQVTCLSCHRAHASGMMYGLRFDIEYEFMTKASNYIGLDNPAVTGSRAGVQTRGRNVADWTAAYYDRPATQFATYQRVLCNKCHAKD